MNIHLHISLSFGNIINKMNLCSHSLVCDMSLWFSESTKVVGPVTSMAGTRLGLDLSVVWHRKLLKEFAVSIRFSLDTWWTLVSTSHCLSQQVRDQEVQGNQLPPISPMITRDSQRPDLKWQWWTLSRHLCSACRLVLWSTSPHAKSTGRSHGKICCQWCELGDMLGFGFTAVI